MAKRLLEEKYPVGELLEEAGVYKEIAKGIDKRFEPETVQKATYEILKSKTLPKKGELYDYRIDLDKYFEEVSSKANQLPMTLNLKEEDSIVLSLFFSKRFDKLWGNISYHHGRELIPLSEEVGKDEIKNLPDYREYARGFNLPVSSLESSQESLTVPINPKFKNAFELLKRSSYITSLIPTGLGLLTVLSEEISYEEFLRRKAEKNKKKQRKFETWLGKNLFHYLTFIGAMLDEGLKQEKRNKRNSSVDIYRKKLRTTSRLFKAYDIYTQYQGLFIPDSGAYTARKYSDSIYVLSETGYYPKLFELDKAFKSGSKKEIHRVLEDNIPEKMIENIGEREAQNLEKFINITSEYEEYYEKLNKYLSKAAIEEEIEGLIET